MVLLLWCQIILLWQQVTKVALEHLYQTIVLPRKLATGSIHDYPFYYCPLVGILFEVLIIEFWIVLYYYFYNISDYKGRWTVPMLFDKKEKTIVNVESGEIIRMLNTEFNAFCKTDEQKKRNYCPDNLKAEIDELNGWISPYVEWLKGVVIIYQLSSNLMGISQSCFCRSVQGTWELSKFP